MKVKQRGVLEIATIIMKIVKSQKDSSTNLIAFWQNEVNLVNYQLILDYCFPKLNNNYTHKMLHILTQSLVYASFIVSKISSVVKMAAL